MLCVTCYYLLLSKMDCCLQNNAIHHSNSNTAPSTPRKKNSLPGQEASFQQMGLVHKKDLFLHQQSCIHTKCSCQQTEGKKKKKGKLYQYEQYLFIILMANMLLAMQTRIDWIIPLASKNFTGWNTGINEANKNFSEKNVTRPGPECTITHDVRASASYN